MTAVLPGRDTGSPADSVPSAPTSAFMRRRLLSREVFSSLALMLVGVTSGAQVMGFTVTGLSGLCFLLAPALLLTSTTVGQRVVITVSLLAFISFAISSQLNNVSVVDQRVIQWGSFLVYFVGFTVIAGRDLARLFSLATGLCVGSCLYYATSGLSVGGLNGFADMWKYAYAPWVTVIGLFVLVRLRVSQSLQAVFLVLLAGASLVLNFRSHALVCLGSAAILLVTHFLGGKMSRVAQIGIVAVFGYALGTVIPAIARSGIAGQAVKLKTESQEISGVPSILAGRTESPLSIAAIMDKPFFGWGSANNITDEVFAHGEKIAASVGFDPSLQFNVLWHLPNGDTSLHSVLFSTWAEGGVFAALAPLMLLAIAATVVWNCPRYGVWAAPVVFIAIQAGWDLMFSPVSYNLLAIFAVLTVAFTSKHLLGRPPGARRRTETASQRQ